MCVCVCVSVCFSVSYSTHVRLQCFTLILRFASLVLICWFLMFFCWSLGHFDYTFPCFFVCFSKLISFLTFACVCGDELEGLSNTLLNGTCLFQQERREKRLVTHAGEMKTNFADFFLFCGRL